MQLEADEPRDDGGGGGGRRKKEVKISFDEPVVKNPKQREPTAADIAKANAMMPVIKLSQVHKFCTTKATTHCTTKTSTCVLLKQVDLHNQRKCYDAHHEALAGTRARVSSLHAHKLSLRHFARHTHFFAPNAPSLSPHTLSLSRAPCSLSLSRHALSPEHRTPQTRALSLSL